MDVKLMDLHIIRITNVWDERPVEGIVPLNNAWYTTEKELDRYERKLLEGVVEAIPLAYSVGLGTPSAMPLDARQVEEVFLTAAQSVFAMAIMVNLSIRLRGAIALLALFLIQFATSGMSILGVSTHLAISAIYLAGTILLVVRDRAHVAPLLREGLFSPKTPRSVDES